MNELFEGIELIDVADKDFWHHNLLTVIELPEWTSTNLHLLLSNEMSLIFVFTEHIVACTCIFRVCVLDNLIIKSVASSHKMWLFPKIDNLCN